MEAKAGSENIGSDMGNAERQRILEDAGYRGCFYRIKYSDWIKRGFDRNKVMRDILSRLS
jgi:hypothetical protein